MFRKINKFLVSNGMILLLLTLTLSVQIEGGDDEDASTWKKRPCSSLSEGQYKCKKPEIDSVKQNEVNCTSDGRVLVACMPAPGITCNGRRFDGKTEAFYIELPCRYVSNYHYKTAVLLSVFLGMFGADRFYLGYFAMGLLKFSTFGFMFIGYLVDMILIITQTLEPIDGSKYIVDYYGQVLHPTSNSDSYYVFNVSFLQN